jgi:hypothetical protein
MGVLLGGHVVFHHSARLSSSQVDSKPGVMECHDFAIDPFTGMDMFICSNHGTVFRMNREGEHHFPDEFYFNSPLESSLHLRDAPSLGQCMLPSPPADGRRSSTSCDSSVHYILLCSSLIVLLFKWKVCLRKVQPSVLFVQMVTL